MPETNCWSFRYDDPLHIVCTSQGRLIKLDVEIEGRGVVRCSVVSLLKSVDKVWLDTGVEDLFVPKAKIVRASFVERVGL